MLYWNSVRQTSSVGTIRLRESRILKSFLKAKTMKSLPAGIESLILFANLQ